MSDRTTGTTRAASVSRKALMLGAAAVALLGGGAAYAYPPGTAMTVSATTSVGTGGQTAVAVTVQNADPTCSLRVEINESKVTLPPGTTTVVLQTKSDRGRHEVKVKTVDCRPKETARTMVDIINARIETSSSIKAGKSFEVKLYGFPPDATVTVVATKGSTTVTGSAVMDLKGKAKLRLTLPAKGTWGTVASGGGALASTSVTVK